MWNVKEFGAVGDGITSDTIAIQAAIDDCADKGGGTVLFPKGTYLSSTIIFKSHVHFQLETGAELTAIASADAYNPSVREGQSTGYLLWADGAEDIGIHGFGSICGTATEDWGSWWGIRQPLEFRIGLLLFINCKNITIDNVRFMYSDSWTLHLFKCESVFINGVKIINNFFRLNTDGIDPDCCKNVFISNCHIIAGDDCICIKASEDLPVENIVVSNCIMETPNTAIKLGTASVGKFQDIRFSNCIIRNTSVGIGIFVKDGALVQRISFSNISVECADREKIKPVIPLFIDIEQRHLDSPAGIVRDVIFSNIQIESGSGCLFQGMPESLLENITLSNITMRVPFASDFSNRKKAVGGKRTPRDDGRDTTFIRKPAYASFAYIRGLIVENFTLIVENEVYSLYPRTAIYGYRIEEASFKGIWQRPSEAMLKGSPLMLEECSGIKSEVNL